MSAIAGTPQRRKFWRFLLLASLVGLLAIVCLLWYATTDSFQAMVRGRLIAELEKVTGGKVELGGIHTIPFRLRVDVRNLTIHGREAPAEVPYAHVDRLIAQVKIISVLGAEFGFDSLVLDHPVVHIIVYPDGTTNQPGPQIRPAPAGSPVQPLFALAIGRLEVRGGELLYNDQRVPVDFIASDVAAGMSYSHLHRRFESVITLGKVDTKLQDLRPFAWRAEAHFLLGRNYVEVSSLKWSSGQSRVEASGRLRDFAQPRIEGTYQAVLDLADLDGIARRHEIRAGMLELQGRGSWSQAEFASDGKLLVRDLDWRDDHLVWRDAGARSDFFLSNRQLRLTQLQARLFGGSVLGDLEVSNWLGPSTAPAEIKSRKSAKVASEETRGLLRLRLKSVSIADLAAALSTPKLPLNRVHLVATTNGSIDARWKGSLHNLEADLALDVTPPNHAAPSELPLTATIRATYWNSLEELEVSNFVASTPASQVRASGKLSTASTLRVFATSTDLDEWRHLLATLHGPAQLPVDLHGRATFVGFATGKFSAINLAGNLQVSDFDWLIPATSGGGKRSIHLDLASVNLRLSPDNFSARNAVLHRGQTDIRFDLAAELIRGRLSEDRPFTAHVEVHNADLEEIEALAGYDYPVSGQLNLTLQASGTVSQPHGEGHLQFTHAVLYGETLEHFTADLRFANQEVELNNIQAAQGTATITGSTAYNLSDSTFHFNLTGGNFDLTRITQLQSRRLSIGGRMDFTAQGAGTREAPAINARIDLHDLTFDQERVGDFTLQAVTQGTDLTLTGRSHFPAAELAVDGDIHLWDNFPANLTVRFKGLDVDSAMRLYLAGHLTGHSSIAGELKVAGPLREPRRLNVTANLDQFFAEVETIKLHNDGPIRITVANEVASLDQLHLVGDLTDLAAHGTMQLAGQRQLNLNADGHINLKLIESLNPDFTSAGRLTLGMSVSGTVSDPVLQGRVEINEAALSYVDVPSGLSNMNGSLLFNQDRLQIESLTARTGGGLFNLGGSASYYRGQLSFDLTAQAQEVRLRYPPGVSSTANADLRLAGTTSSAVLSGDITIVKLALTPGFDFGSYLQRSKQTSAIPNPNSLLNRVQLDIHLTTVPELQMQTALARLSGDADLRMHGTAAHPTVLGRVDIVEGEVSFNRAKYRLERGSVAFTNPVRIEPILDLQLTRHVGDYDITLGLNGTLDKLNINYRSEPPLPSSDVIALLALGRTRTESATLQNDSSSFSQETSNLILSEAVNTMVLNRAQSLFGASTSIMIDPNGPSTETSLVSNAPWVTVQRQVVNNLNLTYSTYVGQTSQQVIQLEYKVTNSISIVALRDYNGVVSFDVKLRKRRK